MVVELNNIVKINNKDEKFYSYMGKFFGSRIVENQTNDRIYDDSNKEWYIYLLEDVAVGFVSVSNDVIKNIYGSKEEYIEELLKEVMNDITVNPSIVTNIYYDTYVKCGFNIDENSTYKNFVVIRGENKS